MKKLNKYWIATAIALGDGYIQDRHGSGNAILSFAHHLKSADYIKWKSDLLLSVGIDNKIVTKHRSQGNNQEVCYTKSYKIIGNIYKRLYKNFKTTKCKFFPLKYAQVLDARALAILFMDDGCTSIQHCKTKQGKPYDYVCGYISTNSFDLISNQNILKWLEKFGIKGRIGRQKNHYRICLNREAILKLHEIIKPYVLQIPSMKYKILI